MDERSGRLDDAFRWLFEDRRTGKIVIGQTPNLPLIVFVCAFAADAALKPQGAAGTIVRGIKVSSLTYFALDELLRGVNPFRRMGGAALLAFTLRSYLLG